MVVVVAAAVEEVRDHSLFMAGGGKNVGGPSKILGNLRGVIKNASRLGECHLLLNTLFSDMLIKANTYYKI